MLCVLVNLAHVLIILFMILAPLVGDPILLILHISSGLTLLLHWALNNDACCLTTLEACLRGIPVEEGVSAQFIQPLYNIPEGEWNMIIKIITILLVLVSTVRLANNEMFIRTLKSSNFEEFNENLKNLVK